MVQIVMLKNPTLNSRQNENLREKDGDAKKKKTDKHQARLNVLIIFNASQFTVLLVLSPFVSFLM